MENVNVLLTGCCSKGVSGIVKSLRQDPRIRIIGVDADTDNELPIFDSVYTTYNGDSEWFVEDISHICSGNKIQIILPQVTSELDNFSKAKQLYANNGVTILISNTDSILHANNKEELFNAVKSFVPIPDYFGGSICAKPKVGHGGKGFRMLPDFDGLQDDEILMEYLPGIEYSIDVLADRGKALKVVVRTRDKVADGLSVISTVVNHPEIQSYCIRMTEALNLHGIVGFQFKEDYKGQPKLLECNPRIQSGVELCAAAGYNMLTNAVKLALGEEIEDTPIKYGTKMIRYYESYYI